MNMWLNLKGLAKKIGQSPNEKGQGLVEYALILVLVAIVVIAVLLTLGPVVSGVYTQVICGLNGGTCAGPYYFNVDHPSDAEACAALGLESGDEAYSFATHEPPADGDLIWWSTTSESPIPDLQPSVANPRTCP
jgi:pilus assembly protein Flp/PilA